MRSPAKWLKTPLSAGLLLLLIYVALSFLDSPRGFLGTDTGGKVATLIEMENNGDWIPEVGYWAAPWDPEARVHGLYFTSVVDGHYVNVTSVPMILISKPLWETGGYRAALLFPMLGAVACAFAARAVARRVSGGDGWAAFWLIGLASPAVIYALDFWEHAPGMALMAWAAVLLFDAMEAPKVRWAGVAPGLLLGAAFAMRSEASTYAFGFLAVACSVRWLTRRDLVGAVRLGVGSVVGFMAVTVANFTLEAALLGSSIRAGRATGTVGLGGSSIDLRLREALVTALSPFPGHDTASYVMAVVLAGAIGYLVWGLLHGREPKVLAVIAVLICIIYLSRFVAGPGFVPGLVAASPLAVAGVVWGWGDDRARRMVLLAVVPLPLVFAFQFPGGALPQWAGRYILTSGLLLASVGAASLGALDRRYARLLVGLSVSVTAFGLVWLAVRTHDVADAADRLESRGEEVLISPNGFVPREFGATYGRKRWLAAGCVTALDECSDLSFAASVAAESGARSMAIVTIARPERPPEFAGWTSTGDPVPVEFITGTELYVISYERTEPG